MEKLEVKAGKYCPAHKTELVTTGPVTAENEMYVVFARCKSDSCSYFEYLRVTQKELDRLRKKGKQTPKCRRYSFF